MILIYYYLIAMGIFSLVILQYFGMGLIKNITLLGKKISAVGFLFNWVGCLLTALNKKGNRV